MRSHPRRALRFLIQCASTAALVAISCAGGGGGGDAPSGGGPRPPPPPPPGSGTDIVYVRYPRRGDLGLVSLPDGENPYAIEPGADLMLLHPDGSEEVLVDCSHGQTSSVQDPSVSFDGKLVYYAKYTGMVAGAPWQHQPASCFIYKMRLDVPAAQRSEIQLSNLGTGFATGKLAGNGPQDQISDFGVRDLGPTPMPGGRILFTSNREATVAFVQGVPPELDALSASTSSQLFVLDDHDGSTPNLNLHRIGYSGLHQVQHPLVLSDGRVAFTNWDDAGLREHYGMATLYTCDQDGSHLNQFLEPHNEHKRVDHFLAELSSSQLVVVDYYPFMRLWGFGILHRYDLSTAPPEFQASPQTAALDFRLFSRKSLVNLTPHTSGEHELAPGLSGRYSTPAAGPGGRLYVAYSPGPVANNLPNGAPSFPFLDSGIYAIDHADTQVVTTPSSLALLKNDPAYNELWPRPVVSYRQIHGVDAPPQTAPRNNLGPTPLARGLVAGSPVGLAGTSSLLNRESHNLGSADFFNVPLFRDNAPPFDVQGTDAGAFGQADVFGVRVIVVTPDRYHAPFDVTAFERSSGLVDARLSKIVKGYVSLQGESWKILGEFPVGTTVSGQVDTSFLARVPANTPFFFQGVDRRGMTLFTEETWRHLAPAQTLADCGGCHAHSIPGVPFQGKLADAAGYAPPDLVATTPVIVSGSSQPQNRTQTGLFGVEFRRDIYPLLASRCADCHTGNPPANGAMLSLFDVSPPPLTFTAAVRAWSALARDPTGTYAGGQPIPAGLATYNPPQVSRYVRAIQARASLLAWRIYDARLDGRSNADFPLPGRPDTADLDFFPAVTCTAATRLGDAEKGLVTRWIDLGCPIDLDRPRMTYTDDHLPPVLVVRLYAEPSGQVQLRVGAVDVESGIDPASLRVTVTPPGQPPLSRTMADLAWDAANSVGSVDLPLSTSQLSAASTASVSAVVSDRAGNSERVDFSVGAVPPVP